MPRPNRVLIADDHPLVGDALEYAVATQLPEAKVFRAETLGAAEAQARADGPFVLALLDLTMPDAEGFTGLLSLKEKLPGTPIVIVSARATPDVIELAQQLGAAGYMPKSMPLAAMSTAIGSVARGEPWFPKPEEVEPEPGAAKVKTRLEELTPTQAKILHALASGRLNKQIAGDFNMTEATVKTHVSAVFRKLGVQNRTQAVLALREAGR